MTTSATKGKAARELLAVGQRWFSGSEEVVITSIDNEPYPVQYKWADGLLGRDDVAGFLESFERPTNDWLAILEADRSQQSAIHEEELMEARELLRTVTVSCPNCDENRRVECSDECVAIAPNIDKARAYLARVGASQQTGTPPCRWPNCSFAGACKDICIANPPAGSGTAETCDCPPGVVSSTCSIHGYGYPTGTGETCGTCGGTKMWQFDYPDNRPSEVRPCPDCGGSGTTKGGKR